MFYVTPKGNVEPCASTPGEGDADAVLYENGTLVHPNLAYLFATRESAEVMAECVREHGRGAAAQACHKLWITRELAKLAVAGKDND